MNWYVDVVATATLGKLEHYCAKRVVGPVLFASARLEHDHWRLIGVQHSDAQHFKRKRSVNYVIA